MGDDDYDQILREVLEATEHGLEITLAEVAARHPGHEDTARRVLADVEHYESLRVEAARPVVFDALSPGERLGDFEIVGRIASGGMGVVYRARQMSLGSRFVALKVLAAESAGPHGVARFEREALALASLHHPHLAEVFGFGEHRGLIYFAMRLVEGPTLRDVLERRAQARAAGAPDDAAARRAIVERIAEVADALALAHQNGLVHRDVKPSNIVLEGAGAASPLERGAVLIDFGLARPVDSRTLTQAGDSPATPSYAPPEQLLGQNVDARADVFSLGVTLHDLLAARRPNERLQASAGLESIRTLVLQIDEDLAAVIAHAVDPEARWRYPDASALRDDLRAWLAGEGVSARRTPLVERMRRWASKHPRRIAQGTLIVVALIVVSVGISGPVATYGNIKAARVALERGDVRDLARAVDKIESLAPIGLFGGARLSDAARRLRSRDESDALVRVRDQLDINNMGAALFVAAETIGARGRERDDLIERFFIACGADDALHAWLRPEDAELWATLAARILYEQPAVDSTGMERAAALRSSVLQAWKRTDVGADERRYLLTALAGCGEVGEVVDPVLTWAFDERRSPEELRQGLSVAERILLRSIRTGTARDVKWASLWETLRGRADGVFDRPAVVAALPVEFATSAMCLAALIATPAQRRPETGWQAWLPRRSAGDLPTERGGRLGRWLACMAIARHEPLMELLRSSEPPKLLKSTVAREFGIVAGLLGVEDPGISAKLRAWCSEAACEGGLDQFDRGLTIGADLLHGLRADTDLDEDTLFGHLAALEFEQFPDSAAGPPLGARFGRPPPASDPSIQMQEHENLREIPIEALWVFHADGALSAGMATRVTQRACTLAQEGVDWFARLPAFGHSELRFDFEVGPESQAHERFVVLCLQTNGREYYPDQGRAQFSLRIGESSLATYTCNTPHPVDIVLALPARWLRLGTNTLSLRLLPSSTTPLRVWSVELKCVP